MLAKANPMSASFLTVALYIGIFRAEFHGEKAAMYAMSACKGSSLPAQDARNVQA